MFPTLILLLAMATIGAIDGTYYHSYKYRLSQQPSSRVETVTHVLRALSLAVALWVLSDRIPFGGWYWAMAALFTFDLRYRFDARGTTEIKGKGPMTTYFLRGRDPDVAA